ncbi:MAG: glycosyltransferase family 2 protein [Candidatus Omnitrophica bacterium]|nr:glycosyltransferase family 2 protein [Candidatus Omnitrophota bacterium]
MVIDIRDNGEIKSVPARDISLVIPIFNERENLDVLYRHIRDVLDRSYDEYEIIFVDDGSTDGSFEYLERLSRDDKKVRVIKFSKNFGQTVAMMAGIQSATKHVLATMDGDMQNDASDIPALTAKLEEGFDLVCGWRRYRKDSFIMRKIPSYIANKMISWFSKVHLHDYGCTLKVYRTKLIKSIHLYGEMHRFIPALVAMEGGRVTELSVKHHPRRKGRSKYGIKRVPSVILDLFVIKFMSDYSVKPIHFFGGFGIASIGLGTAVGLFSLYERYIVGLPGINLLPLMLLTMLLILLGTQTILIGLLAEMDKRSYYEIQQKKTYIIDMVLN